jgi:hypothetical protein
MLMGSTQGASLIFAHYGAFYGATGGLDRAAPLQAIQGSWISLYCIFTV